MLIRNILATFVAGLLQAGLANALSTPKCNCSSLAAKIDFSEYNATFHNATYRAVGNFSGADTHGNLVANNVAFCEVHAAIHYADGAELVFAVWLPDNDNFQGRFLGVGNGGMAGTIHRENMLTQLNSGFGFAVAGGDAGHDAWAETPGRDNSFPGTYLPFLNYEERTRAWIQNAGSIFTPLAKKMTATYYGRDPDHAYWNGCSAGGGQAFALAEFHPDLYDGIFAGSPGNYQSHMWLAILWTFLSQQGERSLSAETLAFVNNAVLDQCDGLDGVNDRVIENPLACPFDVGKLLCPGSHDPTQNGTVTCLAQPQVDAFRAIYAGAKTFDTGEQIHPGFDVGAEVNFIVPVTVGLAEHFSVPILQNLVFQNLTWDPTTFGYTSDEVAFVDAKGAGVANAISTDLSAFRGRGGKMLTTMGWADPALPPRWPIVHRERLQGAMPAGEDVSSFYRLFMVPGGGHCEAVSFPQTPARWHVMKALIDWVEKGDAPESVLATDPADGSGRSRKLCSWPTTARFEGGDVDDAGSYVCQV